MEDKNKDLILLEGKIPMLFLCLFVMNHTRTHTTDLTLDHLDTEEWMSIYTIAHIQSCYHKTNTEGEMMMMYDRRRYHVQWEERRKRETQCEGVVCNRYCLNFIKIIRITYYICLSTLNFFISDILNPNPCSYKIYILFFA